MHRPETHSDPNQYSPRWSIGVVLAVALALMFAVPLAGRAFGQTATPALFPGCGIAAWTGTCTCMLTRSGAAMGFEEFDRTVRNPTVRPRIKDPDAVVAEAHRMCRIAPSPVEARAR